MSNKKEDFEPFDHDIDGYYDEAEFIDGVVRGKSELADSKAIKIKGQKPMMLILVSLAILVTGVLGYFMLKKQQNLAENSKIDEKPTASFVVPEKRSFGEQFDDEFYAVEPQETVADVPVNTSANAITPIKEDTNGLQPTPAKPVETTTIEPPPSFDSQPQAAPVQQKPEDPVALRQQRIFGGGFDLKNNTKNDVGMVTNKEDDTLSNSLTATSLNAQSASRMANRDFIITKGNMIDCVMDTKFDSSVVGMAACTVTHNIYSASGKVVLIDRGSKITGQYKGGFQHGRNRVFILWNRIESPKGVIIDINSPATGSLGEAGLDGYIDTKFWTRFGGAILVSLIDDFGKALSQSAAKKVIGENVTLENTSETAEDMSKATIEKMIDIPPVMTKHQGDRIGIYVARDLSFTNVYGVKTK